MYVRTFKMYLCARFDSSTPDNIGWELEIEFIAVRFNTTSKVNLKLTFSQSATAFILYKSNEDP